MGRCEECPLSGGSPVEAWGNDSSPDIAFVSDFPRKDDLAKGQILSGKGGKLLRQIMTSLGYDLSSVYYTGACLCMTKQGKDPKMKEIMACKDRLMNELNRVNPSIVVPLGNGGVTALLGSGRGITKRRGIYTDGVIPTLHPQAVYASPERFPDLVEDLEYILSVSRGEMPVIHPPIDSYFIVEHQEDLDMLIHRIKTVEVMSVDLETASLDFKNGHILSIGMSWKEGTAVSVDWVGLIEGNKDNFEAISETLSRIKCIFHNGQFDVLWLRERGIDVNYYFDTMLAHYALDERQGSHGLKRLSISKFRAPEYDGDLKTLINRKRDERGETMKTSGSDSAEEDRKSPLSLTLSDWEDSQIKRGLQEYNGVDCDYTYRLFVSQIEEMEHDCVRGVHDNILIPAAHHFIELESGGMLVDQEYHDKMGKQWISEMSEIEEQIRKFPGAEDINLNSPKQLGSYLFDTLKLRPMTSNSYSGVISQDELLAEIQEIEDPEAQDYWRSSTSHIFTDMKPRSTSTYMLFWLAQQHEFPRLLTRHRVVSKLHNTYYEGYREVMWPDGRIRPRYRIHGTRTGRLSSTGPNIHGMPRKKIIKDIFISEPGYSLIHADYSQAEIRMMAHFAKDENLMKAMQEEDIHTAISKELFGLTDEQLMALPDEEIKFKRRAAKTIAFGLIYGRSAKSLAPQLNVSLQEAEAYMKKFFRMMPNVTKWIARQKDIVARKQEVTSLYGRKRRFPFIADGRHMSEVKRQAVNMPIQSSVSDMTLLANMRIIKILRDRGISTLPWPHIHDGFLIQVPDEHLDEAVEVVINCMHDVEFETEVPFKVEVDAGKRWGSMKKIFEG